MIGKNIASAVLDKSTELNQNPAGQIDDFDPIYNIKSFLIDNEQQHSFDFINAKEFSLEVNIGEYNQVLFSDYYFSNFRIIEQVKNIENLIQASSQIAWILVSVYYCNFFIANELARLYGRYIINFSTNDMRFIINNSNHADPTGFISKLRPNTACTVVVREDFVGSNKLNITFRVGGNGAHEAVWHNMGEIMDKVEVEDNLLHHKRILKNIFSKNSGWESPSKVRNDWNYRYPAYFSSEGNNIGLLFSSNISDKEKAYQWGDFRGLNPSEENICASLAYMYHVLNESNNLISNRLGFSYS